MGIFEKSRRNALFFVALGIGQHAVAKAGDTVGENAGRNFATRQYKIADGDLFVHDLVYDAAVNALIVSAKQNEVVIVARKLCSAGLVEHLACGRKIDYVSLGGHKALLGLHLQDGGVAIVDGGRHHQHSLAATVRRVVHAAVLILGIIADVVRFYGDRAAFLRASDNAFPKHGIHKSREKRHNIKSHISPLLPRSVREWGARKWHRRGRCL